MFALISFTVLLLGLQLSSCHGAATSGAIAAAAVHSRRAVTTDWFGFGKNCCRLPYRWGQTSIVSVGGRQGCILGSTMRPFLSCAVKCADCAVPMPGSTFAVGYYTCSRWGGLVAPKLQCMPARPCTVSAQDANVDVSACAGVKCGTACQLKCKPGYTAAPGSNAAVACVKSVPAVFVPAAKFKCTKKNPIIVCTPIANSIPGAIITCTSTTDSKFVNPDNACLPGFFLKRGLAGTADVCQACTPIAYSVPGAAITCTSPTDSKFVNTNNACLPGATLEIGLAGAADVCAVLCTATGTSPGCVQFDRSEGGCGIFYSYNGALFQNAFDVPADPLQCTNLFFNAGSDITSFTEGVFDPYTALGTFNGGYNEIPVLPSGLFAKNTLLKDINLAENGLTSLPDDLLTGLTALDKLNLTGNKLNLLPAGFFTDTKALAQFDISYNQLGSLVEEVFSTTTNLDTLNFQKNMLTSLPPTVFSSLTKMTSMIVCDNWLMDQFAKAAFVNLEGAVVDIGSLTIAALPQTIAGSFTCDGLGASCVSC